MPSGLTVVKFQSPCAPLLDQPKHGDAQLLHHPPVRLTADTLIRKCNRMLQQRRGIRECFAANATTSHQSSMLKTGQDLCHWRSTGTWYGVACAGER